MANLHEHLMNRHSGSYKVDVVNEISRGLFKHLLGGSGGAILWMGNFRLLPRQRKLNALNKLKR